jgi:hypothetical protein
MRDALSDFLGRNGLRPLDPRFEEVTVEQLLTHPGSSVSSPAMVAVRVWFPH